jgi:hypothetical protein
VFEFKCILIKTRDKEKGHLAGKWGVIGLDGRVISDELGLAVCNIGVIDQENGVILTNSIPHNGCIPIFSASAPRARERRYKVSRAATSPIDTRGPKSCRGGNE